ncbi:MAG: hypothetical protein AAGC63_05750, partial [Propionicimonas sp.]|nr:hypothetical protein [Propionicimonas sp.]
MSLSGSIQETRPSRADAVTWLIVYLFFLYAIPSRLVIPALGSAGAPSMVVGLISFLAWGMYQLSRPRPESGDLRPRPVRRALLAFLVCVC